MGCKPGGCYQKSPKQICIENDLEGDDDEGCHAPRTPSVVGGQCKCTGNCTITITGKEIKSYISSTIKDLAGDLINEIKDTDEIIAPNFFPGKENIEGCDELAAVVPDGMTVGCLYDNAKITFPQNMINLVRDLPNKKLKIVITINLGDMIPRDLTDAIADLMEAGIPFTAPNGYCLASTIDISAQKLAIDVSAVGGLVKLTAFNGNPLDKKKGLVSKINTGDHATVVKNAENVDNYCPAGSTLFSYTVNVDKPIDTESEMAGMKADINGQVKIDVGFDMCLKVCMTDGDCREKEGYSCVELPNGVPPEGLTIDDVPKKKACFDNNNIVYFEQLTEMFKTEETTP